jgi:hypothetical protein
MPIRGVMPGNHFSQIWYLFQYAVRRFKSSLPLVSPENKRGTKQGPGWTDDKNLEPAEHERNSKIRQRGEIQIR